MSAVPKQEERDALDEVAKMATNIKAIVWFLAAFGAGGVGLGTWLANQEAKNRDQDAAILRIEQAMHERRADSERLVRIEEQMAVTREEVKASREDIKQLLRQRGNE